MSVTLADHIRNIPPITRFFTVSTVGVCLLDSLGIITPQQLFCSWPIFRDQFNLASTVFASGAPLIYKAKESLALVLQCYRFLVCFLLPAGVLMMLPFNAILDIYFFYTFANHVEKGKFKGSFPDCLWFTLICGTSIVIITLIYEMLDPGYMPLHHETMLSCITYTWSRGLKNSIINFMGIIPIKAYYLPLFNLFVKVIVGGYRSLLDTFIGIVGAYIYQCIQSNTYPIYNLFRLNYPKFYHAQLQKKVGTLANFQTIESDYIPDSVFDTGHLPAPKWLYKLLSYPTKERETQKAEDKSTGSSTGWFNSAFKGKGHRLGS